MNAAGTKPEPKPKQPAGAWLWEKACNLAGAGVYALFGYSCVVDVRQNHRLSSAIALTLVSCFALFFLVRGAPRQHNQSVRDWLLALCGTYLPPLIRPAAAMHDSVLLQGLQIAATCFAIAGILSLNKSLGLVAANRGIKTEGVYRFVRHPIYAGYLLEFSAFWAQNITLPNTLLLVTWIGCEVARIFAEEKLLVLDPDYAAYMKKVRFRLLPGVF